MLNDFMKSQGLEAKPEAVPNLKGDDARAAFIKQFKEVQRLQTQLDQYTDLTEQEKQTIEQVLPKEQLKGFRGQYLETAQRLREQREKPGGDDRTTSDEVDQLDFEFVLFASALIDYDYIMGLIARFTGQDPKKQKMSREQLIGLIESDAKFLDEREAITEYVRSLEAGKALDEKAVREGYQQFKAERDAKEVAATAPEARAGRRGVAGVRRPHPSAADDLQRRAAQRPARPARPRLARPHGKGAGPDGRPRPPAEEARRRAGNLRAQRVRGVRRWR